MPSNLPIAVSDILDHLKSPICPGCGGLGSWRRKLRCRECNGQGTTARDLKSCEACSGRGQVPDQTLNRIDCSECNGFGVVFGECRECRRRGATDGDYEQCRTCEGTGEYPLAKRIAAEGKRQYLEHVLKHMLDHMAKANVDAFLVACKLDSLLLDVCRRADELGRVQAEAVTPRGFRTAFGDARVELKRIGADFEKQAAAERAELLAELSRLRSEALDAQGAVGRNFWSGSGSF
jgi:hypothetical protein